MSRRARWVAGVIALLMIIVPATLILRDAPPPDDADLRFPEPVVLSGQNGAVVLLEALAGEIATDPTGLPSLSGLRPFGADPAAARALPEYVGMRARAVANTPAITALERAARAPHFSFTGLEGREALGVLLRPFIEEAAIVAWAEGDPRRAREILETWRAIQARSLRRHPGAFHAITILNPGRRTSLRQLTELAASADLARDELEAWLADPGPRVYGAGWETDYFRQDYVIFAQDLRSGAFQPFGQRRFLRVERTITAIADRTREMLRALEEGAVIPGPRDASTLRMVGEVLGGNLVGSRYTRYWPVLGPFAVERVAATMEERQFITLRTLLALRIERLARGAWPASAAGVDRDRWPSDLPLPEWTALSVDGLWAEGDEDPDPDTSTHVRFDPATGRWSTGGQYGEILPR